jgi:hypothetical protein
VSTTATKAHPWCGGKIRYETREQAMKARAHLPYGSKLDVFPCRACAGYHLGGGPTARRGHGWKRTP